MEGFFFLKLQDNRCYTSKYRHSYLEFIRKLVWNWLNSIYTPKRHGGCKVQEIGREILERDPGVCEYLSKLGEGSSS